MFFINPLIHPVTSYVDIQISPDADADFLFPALDTITKSLRNLFRTMTKIKPLWNPVKFSFFRELNSAMYDSSANSTCTYNKSNSYILFFYYNDHSLIPKMDELKAVSEATKPDIILYNNFAFLKFVLIMKSQMLR